MHTVPRDVYYLTYMYSMDEVAMDRERLCPGPRRWRNYCSMRLTVSTEFQSCVHIYIYIFPPRIPRAAEKHRTTRSSVYHPAKCDIGARTEI